MPSRFLSFVKFRVLFRLFACHVINDGLTTELSLADWFEITYEEAEKLTDPFLIYIASKTLAERAVWAFADKHPLIEMTTGECALDSSFQTTMRV